MFGFQHRKICEAKRQERQDRIDALPEYLDPLTREEIELLDKPSREVVQEVQSGSLKPISVLRAYGKQAIKAQSDLNIITEVMIKDSEKWTSDKSIIDKPLAGFPVSMKDTCAVTGYDSSIGYSANCFKPLTYDSPLIKLLKDAGGIPYVKTNVPYTMLSFECYNDVWGVSENPHVRGYVPGGSTGGESALLAYGGSRLGMGTDVAGSVRIPAHFSGIYSLKCSTGRIPKYGNITSMAGQEGIPAVYSPMTRTLDDLGFFLKVIIDMKPWNYDYSVHPIPWREVELPKKCKIGVIYDDGVVTPAPACARALNMTVDALKKQGHDVVEFDAPSPLNALRIASQLLISDGGKVALRKQVWGEHNDAGVERMVKAARLPRFVMKLYAWYLEHIKGDKVWATLVQDWHVKTITERWDLVAERESYKAEFHQAWQSAGIDFLITVPNATPALPHKGLVESISSCGYTFLFNLLDYAAGVLPVTKVDKSLDSFDVPSKGLNRVARGAYVNYDSAKMHGLPVGVQVVGQRLQEELTFKAMQLVEQALRHNGVVYKQKSVN